jgi:type I restriction enzyme, S subunit
MNPYPSYKGSGVEWIGEIPRDWSISKLKYDTLTPVKYGMNISSDKYIEEGIRFIRITDLTDWGELIKTNGKYLIKDDVSDEFLLDKYDLLLCRSGHTVGKSYLHNEDGDYTSGGYLVKFNFGNYTKSKFIFYISKTDFYWYWIQLNTVTSTIENVNGEKYSNMVYPKPPSSEQTQIVSFLDTKTQKIDELIEKTEQKIELLREKRTSLINHCVTKGLNPNVEMKDSGVEWIGEIPNNFIIGKLGFYCKVFRGSGYQYLNQVDDDFIGKKEKVVRIGDFSQFNPIWCEYIEQFENYRIRNNNILVGGTGHYFGKSMFVTEEMVGLIHSYNIIRLEIYQQFPKFIQYYISSNLIREQMDISVLGSGQPFIDIQGLKDLHLIIPSMKEQFQIVSFLDEQTQKIDSTIEKETQRIELLKEYRQSLISEVVTGKVDVRD